MQANKLMNFILDYNVTTSTTIIGGITKIEFEISRVRRTGLTIRPLVICNNNVALSNTDQTLGTYITVVSSSKLITLRQFDYIYFV